MIRHRSLVFLVVVWGISQGTAATAAPIALINPGGEAYPTGPNTAINPGGVDPIGDTGWNSTLAGTPGTDGAEGINNNAHSGVMRLAFGATNTSANAPQDFVLFQETDAAIQALDLITMNFEGRAFFQYDVGIDFQTSVFGYRDGGGNLVPIDAQPHPSTVVGAWNPTFHTYLVPNGSPLVGENLVIGFFTDTTANLTGGLGGFSSIDDVTLDVTAIPEPASWALGLLGGLAGLACVRRGRLQK